MFKKNLSLYKPKCNTEQKCCSKCLIGIKNTRNSFEEASYAYSVLSQRNKKWVMWHVLFYISFIQAQEFKYKVMFREPDTWWKFKPKELER